MRPIWDRIKKSSNVKSSNVGVMDKLTKGSHGNVELFEKAYSFF